MIQNQSAKSRCTLRERPAQVHFADGAAEAAPLVAAKPGKFRARLPDLEGTRRCRETTDSVNDTHRVDEGMLVLVVDLDAISAPRDLTSALNAIEPNSGRCSFV